MHAVGERKIIGHHSSRTVAADHRDHSWRKLLAGHEVKATAVDVGVAAAVDHHLVPRRAVRERAQIGVRHQ